MKEKQEMRVVQKQELQWAKPRRFRIVAMMMALVAALSVSAFAEGETTTGGFDSVMGSFDTLSTLMGKVWTLMTSNALLTLFLAVSLLGVGVAVFRMIKRAARR